MPTPFVKELLTYLDGTHSLGTDGTDLFADFLPDVTASPCTAVKETGGPAGPPGIPIATTSVQVMVRASDYPTARQHAAKIYNVFHGIVGVSLTNNRIRTGIAQGAPQRIEIDNQKRHYISANYEFETHAITSSGEASTGVGGDKDPNLN